MAAPSGLNLGPNPRRRESFSSSYKPYETVQTADDGRPIAHTIVSEEPVVDDEDVEDLGVAPASPRPFARGMRSFSASYPTSAEAKKAAAAAAVGPAQGMAVNTQRTNSSNSTTGDDNNGNNDNDASMAKSPAEGGWWFNGIKDH